LADVVKVLKFESAMKIAAKYGESVLLLGNGFSIGAHPAFKYGTLYEQAVEAGLPDHVQQLFAKYGTANFERVLRQLDEGIWLATVYELSATNPKKSMKRDYRALKKALASAIAKVHPPSRATMDGGILKACAEFLIRYQGVYTTNYDLLLYWASLAKSPKFPFEDGFLREGNQDYCVFQSPENLGKRIHFLHGALHLYVVDGEVRKRVWNSTGELIVDQVRQALESKEFPLIVSEGDAVKKEARIESSSYLTWAHEHFERAEGPLFIYGSSLSPEDEHLWRAIVENPGFSRVFVGIHGDPDSESAQEIMFRSRKLAKRRSMLKLKKRYKHFPDLRVSYFDSDSAGVWTPSEDTLAP